jgi:hypothetical protein
MADDATFSEFNALRRRQKGTESAKTAHDDAVSRASAPSASTSQPAPTSTQPSAPAATSPIGDVDTVNLFMTEWFRVLMIGLVVHDIVASVWMTFVDSRGPSVQTIHVIAVAHELFDLTSALSITISLIEAFMRLILAYKHGLSPWRLLDMCLVTVTAYLGFWRGMKGEHSSFVWTAVAACKAYSMPFHRPGYRLFALFRLWRFWEHLHLVVTALREDRDEVMALVDVERKVNVS